MVGIETATWDNANTMCNAYGGTLATITSQEEDDTVNSLITDTAIDLWIGLNDKTTEGTFAWVADGSALGVGWTNWYGSNPTSDPSKDPNASPQKVHDCVAKKATIAGANFAKWDDVGCGKSFHVACRTEAYDSCNPTTFVSTVTPTPSGGAG